MKLSSTIDRDITTSELLLNKDLYKIFKQFFLYVMEEGFIEDKWLFDSILEILETSKNDFDMLPKDYFEILWKAFSNDILLATFLSVIDWYNIDEKIRNDFLIVWDYLLNIYKKSQECANRELYISSSLNQKIEDILKLWSFKNSVIKLKYDWFPTIDNAWFPIVNALSQDFIDIWWNKKLEEVYIKVVNSDDKLFYQNIDWDILNFKQRKIKNNDFELVSNEVLIVDSEGQKVLCFDEYFNRTTLKDLVWFMNLWNTFALKLLSKVVEESNFTDIKISKIFGLYDFNWVKFIKFSIDEFTSHQNTYIMKSDWTFLIDDSDEDIQRNISTLFPSENIIAREYVPFSYFDFSIFEEDIDFDLSPVEWYIDVNWNIIYVKWEQLFDVSEIQFRDYYMINLDKNFIISKRDLEKELKKYQSFNTLANDLWLDEEDEYLDPDLEKIWGNNENGFIIGVHEKFDFYGFNIEKIVWKIEWENELDLYIKNDEWFKEIFLDEFSDFFKVYDETGEILGLFTYHTNRICWVQN